jgi:hypothetical protein
MTFKSRGQLQDVVNISCEEGEDVVNISCEEGERRAATFKKHLQSKGIDIIKNSKYKHYDFHLTNDRNTKIELKSVNADIDIYKYVF